MTHQEPSELEKPYLLGCNCTNCKLKRAEVLTDRMKNIFNNLGIENMEQDR